jgi:hypothetical protein
MSEDVAKDAIHFLWQFLYNVNNLVSHNLDCLDGLVNASGNAQ